MLYGRVLLTLDAKGRMQVPALHRDALLAQSQGRLFVTLGARDHLLVYTPADWETKSNQLAALPFEADALKVRVLGSVSAVDVDAAGRMLIPATLRKVAKLDREVMWIGVGSVIQIWNVALLADFEQTALGPNPPESVRNFQF